jgi:hypothetical protein
MLGGTGYMPAMYGFMPRDRVVEARDSACMPRLKVVFSRM